MLRILSAASGEELMALEAVAGSTVGAVKRHLALHLACSRFQLRLLREGHGKELRDDEPSMACMALMRTACLPREAKRDEDFLHCCREGLAEEVEERLLGLQEPNVPGALRLAAGGGHLEVLHLLHEALADLECSGHVAWSLGLPRGLYS